MCLCQHKFCVNEYNIQCHKLLNKGLRQSSRTVFLSNLALLSHWQVLPVVTPTQLQLTHMEFMLSRNNTDYAKDENKMGWANKRRSHLYHKCYSRGDMIGWIASTLNICGKGIEGLHFWSVLSIVIVLFKGKCKVFFCFSFRDFLFLCIAYLKFFFFRCSVYFPNNFLL